MAGFNTQPPEGGCVPRPSFRPADVVSTHSRPKAAAYPEGIIIFYDSVSTHSRPKAAARTVWCSVLIVRFQHTAARRRLHRRLAFLPLSYEFQHTAARRRLPAHGSSRAKASAGFNTQPPEGGCKRCASRCLTGSLVSTHSRPKAAATSSIDALEIPQVSTHSRPKAAASRRLHWS